MDKILLSITLLIFSVTNFLNAQEKKEEPNKMRVAVYRSDDEGFYEKV